MTKNFSDLELSKDSVAQRADRDRSPVAARPDGQRPGRFPTFPPNRSRRGLEPAAVPALWATLPKDDSTAAFTRLDLAATVTMLILFASLAWPVLASSRGRSERAVCGNNLRQIGQAFNIYAAENGNLNSWWIPYVVGVTRPGQGGTRGHPLDQNAFLHFSWLSNRLRTPKILHCPSDKSGAVALDFGASPMRGFMNVGLRNNAISYWLGIHSFYDDPQSLLSGDSNLRVTSRPSSCSTGINGLSGLDLRRGSVPQWTNDLHGIEGNLLFSDGRVVESSNADLRRHVTPSPNAFSQDALHFLYPE